ncbi:MAG: hypothetical protein P8M11_04230 [Planctomycetota bacterium]|nr:hypothetical protein [Planctomycetota bacterium]MDG1983751.1 hypothetical protein [Planctomycetota bacterium]
MKLPILLSAAALTISGLALLTNLNSSPGGARVDPTVKNDAGLNEVRGEIAALRGELNDLSGRLEVLANRPVAPSRIPAGDLVEQSDIDALRAELLEELGDSRKAPGAAGLKQGVAVALEEVRADERDAKAAARRDAMMSKLDEQMPKLQQELGLTSSQTDGLRGVLQARDARYTEMARLWESGDRAGASELKGNERDTHQLELQSVLNEQQIEQFNAMGGGRGRGGK